jgi:uncharacterized protein YjdB
MTASAPTFIRGQGQVFQSGDFFNFNYRGVGETTYAAMAGSLTYPSTELNFAILANVGKIYQFEGFLVGTSVSSSSGERVRQNILVTSFSELNILPTAITVSAPTTSAEVVKGLPLQLSAAFTPSNTTNTALTWTSATPAVATVSSSGLVTAVEVGTSVITATSVASSSISGSITVTVVPAPLTLTGVEFGIVNSTLKVGQTKNSLASLKPDGYQGQGITFTSESPDVAAITSTGIIQPKSVGTAVINAAAVEDPTKTDSITITVEAAMEISAVPTANGTAVVVNGVVTRFIDKGRFYIQNGDSAILVLGYAGSLTIQPGDYLNVNGTSAVYANVRQIAGTLEIQKIDFLTAPTIQPLVINGETDTNITTPDAANFGRLVTIEGLFISPSWTPLASTGSASKPVLLGNTSLTMRFESTFSIENRNLVNDLFDDFWKNDRITFTGIYTGFDFSNTNFLTSELQLAVSDFSDFELVEAEPVLVQSITVTASQSTLKSDGILQLSASILPLNADKEASSIVWTSNQTNIATVGSFTGLVSGVAEGNVTITATIIDVDDSVVTGTIDLIVRDEVNLTDFTLSATNTLLLDETTTIVVTSTPQNWGGTYSYSVTEGTGVVDIVNGVVTGKTVGSAVITVTPVGDVKNIVEAGLNPKTISFTVVAPTYATDLIISEVYEGASNNKYVELFNGTGQAINLKNYTLRQGNNGSTFSIPPSTTNYFQISSTDLFLGHNETFVVYHTSINQTTFASLLNNDIVPANRKKAAGTSGFIGFNGDDSIGLFKNDTLIDVFGVEGTQPSGSWTLPTGGTTADHSVVRNSSVRSPRVDIVSTKKSWLDSEWTANSISSGIGTAGGTPAFHLMSYK